tara:strand:+ start:304 stop:441 length:138 start_codon:yes stop_codon:yes gene_type:complete
MLVGGGILMLAPMYLNPTAGINGLTLIGIVVAIAGATKLITDERK